MNTSGNTMIDKKLLQFINDDVTVGPVADSNNLQDYVLSDKGGAWIEDEIYEPLIGVTRQSALSTIDQVTRRNHDYCMVLFSGHGYYDPNKKATAFQLKLDTDEVIYDYEIQNISKKLLVLVDCCRVPDLMENLINKAQALHSFSESNQRDEIRQLYDNKIASASNQFLYLYSCAIGEESTGKMDFGGTFLSSLLQVGKEFRSDTILTINQAFLNSLSLVKDKNKNQNPTGFGSKGAIRHLPFAINVT